MPHSVDIYILYVYAQSSCTYVSRFYKMSRNPFAPVTPYEFSCIPALPSVNTYKHIYIHTYIQMYIYMYIYICIYTYIYNKNNNNLRVSNIRVSNRTLIYNVCPKSALT